MNLYIENAYNFYKTYIYNEKLNNLYLNYNIASEGHIGSKTWELFSAILLEIKGKNSHTGIDLHNFEIKSFIDGEKTSEAHYEFYKYSYSEKLDSFYKINHVYILYSKNYKNIAAYLIHGKDLIDIFDVWKERIRISLTREVLKNGYFRFVPTINKKIIIKRGIPIMIIENTNLQYASNLIDGIQQFDPEKNIMSQRNYLYELIQF